MSDRISSQMEWFFAIVIGVLAFLLYVYMSATAAAQGKYTKLVRPVDIKWEQRIVAVSDSNDRTLTLVPGGTGSDWVCAPYVHGKSCKTFGEVVAWILQEAK